MSLVEATKLAGEAADECAHQRCSRRESLRLVCEVGVRVAIEKAIADARAAGYAEAIEKAAVLCDSWHVTCCVDVAMTDLGNEVRALAPAATPEKP